MRRTDPECEQLQLLQRTAGLSQKNLREWYCTEQSRKSASWYVPYSCLTADSRPGISGKHLWTVYKKCKILGIIQGLFCQGHVYETMAKCSYCKSYKLHVKTETKRNVTLIEK